MSDLPAQRPTWAEIDLDNLTHNFRVTKAALGAGVAIMPAVKADAYGHGAIECARALETAGAEWFGVALPEEGFTLRNAGIGTPILCLGGFWEGQEESIIAHRLTPAVFRLDILDRLNQAARTAAQHQMDRQDVGLVCRMPILAASLTPLRDSGASGWTAL